MAPSSGWLREKRWIQKLSPEETADKIFLAMDWLTRQGELVAWLGFTGRQEDADQVKETIQVFLDQWGQPVRDDLLYTFTVGWKTSQQEIVNAHSLPLLRQYPN